ncbi:aminopeptidase [Candidatus Woesearchaeota archaeon]|nr:aminopeptidase [Candidatus Woesearchaeota archaeon]
MEFIQSFNWLEKNGYFDVEKTRIKQFTNILKQTLKPKGEEALIIGDTGFENHRMSTKLTSYYFLAAERLRLNPKIYLQEPKNRGELTNPEIIRALAHHKEENLIMANLSNKFGTMKGLGNSYRSFCKKQGHRFISTTSLGTIPNDTEAAVLHALDVDYKTLSKKHSKLKEILDEGKRLIITTDAGTDIKFNIAKKTSVSADGMYSEPGRGGNLPSGEVYIPPRKKSVWGKVVIDGSSRTATRTHLVQNPFTIHVDEGEITKITGSDEGKKLVESLLWAKQNSKHGGWGVRRIGEIGIGLNPNAKLIGSTIIDEKAAGTAHVAIGSNHWFGGTIYAIIHLDQVFKNPVIEVDGSEINTDKL